MKVLPTVSDFMHHDTVEEIKIKSDNVPGKKYKSVGEAILLNVERKDELIERRLSVIQGGSILEVKDLKKHYPIRTGMFGRNTEFVKAVDGITFEVYPGETIGLVGESGCGKTTLGKLLIRLLDPTSGKIIFNGRDIASLTHKELRELRKSMQIIFQDPYSTLNPRQTIGDAILEPMMTHRMYNRKKRKEKVFKLLERVGLKESAYNRYPHEFSGGERQRISIARTLSLNPEFIILDESVSALDVSVQAQVLNLLNQLKKDFGFTYIFISHDLSVVKFMCDRLFVMRDGKFIEMGFSEDIYLRPRDSYTKKLIDSIPKGDLEDIRKNMLRRSILNTARQIRNEIKSKHG
jgi:peptide/nickel transport system ATP-binding protein